MDNQEQLEQQTQAEETVTETPASEEVVDSGGEESTESQTAGTDDATSADGVTATEKEPEYVPNTKFKVHDQERDFDEFIKPALNKETEAKIRELYEKAYGLDVVKPKLETERQAHVTTKQQLQAVVQDVREVMALKEEDLGLFFDAVKLTPQQVVRWAVEWAKKNDPELPPEQRQYYNELDRLRRDNYELKRKHSAQSTGSVNLAVQARTQELQTVMALPEHAQLAQAFDARLGRPGAFQDFVIRHGKSEFEASGRDLSAAEAVREVIQLLGLSPAASTAAKPVETAPQQTKPTVVPATKPKVLPKIEGTGASSAGKRPRSLDDLRKLAKEVTD